MKVQTEYCKKRYKATCAFGLYNKIQKKGFYMIYDYVFKRNLDCKPISQIEFAKIGSADENSKTIFKKQRFSKAL